MVMFFRGHTGGSRGYTLVEMMVTIVIIGILVGLSVTISRSYTNLGEDAERESDTRSIARAFEISYTKNAPSSGPSYPTTTQATTVANYPALFNNQDLAITKAPASRTATSIVAASSTSAQQPTATQYVYQPFSSTGALCTAASANDCVRFVIWYRDERTKSAKSVESIHQQ